MNERKKSLLMILVMYAGAFLAGAVVYFLLPGDILVRAFAADLAMTVAIWFCSLATANASVYDPYWSVVPPYLLILVAVDAGAFSTATFALLLALLVWAVRLTLNWASLWTGFDEQDWRYDLIRAKAPRLWPLTSFIGVMLFPTLIVFAQLAGAIRVVSGGFPIDAWSYAGAVAIVAAAFIQYVADRQMASFRARNGGRKACIEEGLWRLSRHPNYFGEVLVWWGVYLFYFGAVGSIDLFLLAPVLMTVMFLFISIPMMEKKLLASRPQYAEYRRRVSMLIPFFRRPDPPSEDDRISAKTE